jgi:hypothetical protein
MPASPAASAARMALSTFAGTPWPWQGRRGPVPESSNARIRAGQRCSGASRSPPDIGSGRRPPGRVLSTIIAPARKLSTGLGKAARTGARPPAGASRRSGATIGLRPLGAIVLGASPLLICLEPDLPPCCCCGITGRGSAHRRRWLRDLSRSRLQREGSAADGKHNPIFG